MGLFLLYNGIMIIDGIRYCNVCYVEIPRGEGRVVYCSDECKNKAVKRPKSKKAVPEYENKINEYACSYDEYSIDPEILRIAEENEAKYIQQIRLFAAASRSVQRLHDGRAIAQFKKPMKNTINRFS
jgi:predicted nucleic acid-binding Zn ribbon protein|tara:strand:- start:355 stop:735 length:381 start_codon:yes stop_codon:yes gene_type:complete